MWYISFKDALLYQNENLISHHETQQVNRAARKSYEHIINKNAFNALIISYDFRHIDESTKVL